MTRDKYKGGVIIIGSLLWDEESELRKNWRNRLDIENKILVNIPIRYGRLSGGDVYTMVFSKETEKNEKLGVGYICSFSMKMIDLNGIIDEARELAKAENKSRSKNKLCNEWGAIGILFNPKLDGIQRNNIFTKWKEIFQIDLSENTVEDFHMENEDSSINNNGELKIKWPTCVDKKTEIELNDFDFLIATTTKPFNKQNPNQYPIPSEIAITVDLDNKRNYYTHNVLNGIRTNEDLEIFNNLTSQDLKNKLKAYI